jgi:uncharacterized membrane protein HdeD (DUF308 family)
MRQYGGSFLHADSHDPVDYGRQGGGHCGPREDSPVSALNNVADKRRAMITEPARSSPPARPGSASTARDHWQLHLVEGALLVLLGLFALFMPPWFGIALFGWLFLVGGLAGLITTFVMWRAPGFYWSLLSATLTMGVGAMLFMQPLLGIVTLFFLLVAFLILEGIVTIMFGLEHWRQLGGRWGWMLASGIVDLSLAAVILIGLPGSSAWAVGLIIGINLVFGGAAMIGMAVAARPRIGDPVSC